MIAPRRPPRILIVEDDAALLRGLSDNFRSAGFEVETATDGEIGLARVLAEPPDLLLLDIMLPRLNGFDLCLRVRQMKLELPILMLTAKGQEEDVVRGLELGADDYVTKPFGIRELLARVKGLMRRRMEDTPERVEIGGAMFDRASHKLTREGQEIALTTKEYRLLEFLLSRPNRAITRKEIMDNVWGRSIIVSGRSVDRCVATLRSKIEGTPGQPRLIQTIRDVNYRFELPE